MYTTKRMNVVKLIIQKTGTFNEQYRRPYSTNLTANVEQNILNSVNGRQNIKASTVAGAAMDFIAPSATPETNVPIANGWGTPRLRFLLEIQHVDHMGVKNNEYVTGYTEHSDVSMNGLVDPKMTFYCNNISRTRVQEHLTPLGNQTYQSVIDNSHVLVNDRFTNAFDANRLYTLAPESVASHIGSSSIMADSGDVFYDGSTALTKSQPTKSSRTNNIAPVYVASLLDAYLQSARSEEYAAHDSILEDVRNSVSTSSFTEDPFLMWMMNHKMRQGYGASLGNVFTLDDLCALDPNTPNVMMPANMMPSNTHSLGTTMHWGGSDGFTLTASIVSQSLPAYMSQFCFTKLHFTSTNYTLTGEIVTTISDVRGFNISLDQSKELSALIYRLNTELLAGISYNNTMPFKIEVRCDLMGETWIEVSLNSEPPVMFVTPSYADALMTPIVTTNSNVLAGISRDFDGLMTSIVEATSPSSQSQSGFRV